MKMHESLKPRMEEAARSLYGKVRRCSFNSEIGKKMLIVPNDDEITLIHWLVHEFAEENDFEV